MYYIVFDMKFFIFWLYIWGQNRIKYGMIRMHKHNTKLFKRNMILYNKQINNVINKIKMMIKMLKLFI